MWGWWHSILQFLISLFSLSHHRYCIIALSLSYYRVIAPSSWRYRFIVLLYHRHRAIVPSPLHHRAIVIAFSHYRPQPRWCDGAIVNCVVLSAFQTKRNKLNRNFSYLEHGPFLPVARLSVLANISKTNIPVCASFNILTTNIFDLSDIIC